MKNLIVLGIGSNSFEKLNTSSFAIELYNNNWLLTDCGPDIPRQINKAKISFWKINTIILTHRHLDHCLGVPYLLFGRNLEILTKTKSGEVIPDDNKNLNIVCEEGLFNKLIDFFSFCHPDVKLQYDIKFINILEGTNNKIILHNHELFFYPVDHTVPAFGYKLRDPMGKSIAYSTDTILSDIFIEGAKGVDILIHEAMVPTSEIDFSSKAKHSTASQAGEAIKLISPKKSLLMHLKPSYYEKRFELEKEAAGIANMQLEFPAEGSIFEI